MRFVIVRHDVALTPAAWMLDTRSDRCEAACRRGRCFWLQTPCTSRMTRVSKA